MIPCESDVQNVYFSTKDIRESEAERKIETSVVKT